jgi:hypothetical protein
MIYGGGKFVLWFNLVFVLLTVRVTRPVRVRSYYLCADQTTNPVTPSFGRVYHTEHIYSRVLSLLHIISDEP